MSLCTTDDREDRAGVGGLRCTQGNGSIFAPVALSATGQVVAFDSDASNLVAGDTNGFTDTFVHVQ
jgi:hypothetical protein